MKAISRCFLMVLLLIGAVCSPTIAISTEEFFELVKEGSPEEVQKAIAEGADVNAQNVWGDTALIIAARYNKDYRVIDALIEGGAEIDAQNDRGRTPLILASWYNENPDIIIFLLDAGADKTIKDIYGNTAFDYIKTNKSLQETEAYFGLSGVMPGPEKVDEEKNERKNVIRIRPIWMNLTFERAISNIISFRFELGNTVGGVSPVGVAIGGHVYPGGGAPKGLYFGGGAGMAVVLSDTENSDAEFYPSVGIGGEIGYQWVTQGGFVITPLMGANITSSGLWPNIGIGIGFAF